MSFFLFDALDSCCSPLLQPLTADIVSWLLYCICSIMLKLSLAWSPTHIASSMHQFTHLLKITPKLWGPGVVLWIGTGGTVNLTACIKKTLSFPNEPSHLSIGQCCAERQPEADFPWKMNDLASRTGKWKLCFPTASGTFSGYRKCWICKTVCLVRSAECTLILTWLVIRTITAPNRWTGNVEQTNAEIKPFCLNLINFPGTLLINTICD